MIALTELSDAQLAALAVRIAQEVGRRATRRDPDEPADLWPEQVFDAAREVFGDVVYGEGRVRKALNRRIHFAMDVWNEKYGPLNLEQEQYAAEVLAAAIRSAARDAHRDPRKLYPFVYKRLLDAVNHETVHDGFQKRSGAVARDLATPGFREVA